MEQKAKLKPCPFCGGKVECQKGPYGISCFICSNSDCRAITSFGGTKILQSGASEAKNPVKNFNRRRVDQLQNNAKLAESDDYPF